MQNSHSHSTQPLRSASGHCHNVSYAAGARECALRILRAVQAWHSQEVSRLIRSATAPRRRSMRNRGDTAWGSSRCTPASWTAAAWTAARAAEAAVAAAAAATRAPRAARARGSAPMSSKVRSRIVRLWSPCFFLEDAYVCTPSLHSPMLQRMLTTAVCTLHHHSHAAHHTVTQPDTDTVI